MARCVPSPPSMIFSSRALLHRGPLSLASLGLLSEVGTQTYEFGPPSVHIPHVLYWASVGSMHITGCDWTASGERRLLPPVRCP